MEDTDTHTQRRVWYMTTLHIRITLHRYLTRGANLQKHHFRSQPESPTFSFLGRTVI